VSVLKGVGTFVHESEISATEEDQLRKKTPSMASALLPVKSQVEFERPHRAIREAIDAEIEMMSSRASPTEEPADGHAGPYLHLYLQAQELPAQGKGEELGLIEHRDHGARIEMPFLPRSSPAGQPIERVGWLWREPITRHHRGTNREQLRELILGYEPDCCEFTR
jgi:hypothetical protein